MATKRLTGDLARTTVGLNPGVDVPGLATQVLGLTDWTMTIKVKAVDATTTDDDAWEDSLPSSASWSVKAKYVYEMGDSSQMTNIIQAAIGTGRRTSSEWNFFLDSTSGDDGFSGQAYISGLGIPVVIGRTVTLEVTLQGRGPLNLRNQAGFLASLTLPSMVATKFQTSPLSGYSVGAIWSNFVLSSVLPPDAVIVAIRPVIIASAVEDICFHALVYSAVFTGGFGSELSGAGFTLPSNINGLPGTTFASTEFYDVSIGTSLSALAGQKIAAAIYSSLDHEVIADSMTVYGLGFAIDYTSSAPLTDPLMPAPVTVPSGHGLAWALPFSVDLITSPWGTIVATPATAEE